MFGFGKKEGNQPDNGMFTSDPGASVFEGCVAAHLNGSIQEQRAMWVNMFIQVGDSEEKAVDCVDRQCKIAADWYRKFKGLS